MTSFGLTRTGVARKRNEDRFLIKEYSGKRVLLVVADGMGGHAAGDRAAEMACQGLQSFDADAGAAGAQLLGLVRQANLEMLEAARQDATVEGMGTTLTAAFVEGLTAHWVHAGDSRLYLWRDRSLVQITSDHSYPGMLLKGGELSAEEARTHPLRNLLLNCLGRPELELDAGALLLQGGELLLLSTDGLHDWIPQAAIMAVLDRPSLLEEKLQALTQAALAAGGRDDITVVAAQF